MHRRVLNVVVPGTSHLIKPTGSLPHSLVASTDSPLECLCANCQYFWQQKVSSDIPHWSLCF